MTRSDPTPTRDEAVRKACHVLRQWAAFFNDDSARQSAKEIIDLLASAPAPASGGVDAVARAIFDRRHPFENWAAFDERFEARGDKLHPMQEEAIEDAKIAIATLASLSPAATQSAGVDLVAAARILDAEADFARENLEAITDDEAAHPGNNVPIRTVWRDRKVIAERCAAAIRALSPAATPVSEAGGEPFQQRVQPWMMACFGAEISADVVERNHRFLEEALELVQSTGCTASEAHQLVDYVFGRDVGETHQEIGGVMVTLAALCLALGEDMHAAGETELARIWTKVEKIRAKQAAKPKHSPLPQALATPASSPAGGDVREAAQFVYDKFVRDREQGYVTRDKTLAIDILGRALSPSAGPAVEADMRRVCEALGFDPGNHHNALKCPYCNPKGLQFAHPAPATVEMRGLRDLEDAILACERGTMSDVLANYRTVRRTIQDTRAALAPATEGRKG